MEDDDEDLEGAELVEDEEPEADESAEEPEASEDESEAEPEAPPAEGRDSDQGSKRRRGLESAAAAERKKRQEMQAELARVQQELAYVRGRMEQGAQPQTEQEPDEEDEPLDLSDLDASVNRRVEKRAQRLLSKRERERAAEREADWQARVRVSEREAREEYEDYDEVVSRFARRAQSDPDLQRLVRAQADPAEWSYQNQKRFDRRQQKGTGKVSELEAEIADLKAQLAGKQKPAGPRSLASARGAGPRPRANAGPTDPNATFSDVFKKGA